MILGIDGGGSKTRFVLTDRQGRVLADCSAGSSNYLQVGLARFGQIVKDGIAEVCGQAQVAASKFEYAVIGAPGYGEIAHHSQILAQTVAELLPGPHTIVNDVKLAWAGSLACLPGIVALAGTGSMAYAVDAAGRDLRSGGWGHHFGDEGSAYWLGLQCCQRFSKLSDGRLLRSEKKGELLYRMLRQHTGLERDFDLIDLVANNMSDTRRDIAALAPVVYRAAVGGDEEAKALFAAAGRELALLVTALIPSFTHSLSELRISYAGGVFAAGDLVLQPMLQALKEYRPGLRLLQPQLEPALGACLYGALQLGYKRDAYLGLLGGQ